MARKTGYEVIIDKGGVQDSVTNLDNLQIVYGYLLGAIGEDFRSTFGSYRAFKAWKSQQPTAQVTLHIRGGDYPLDWGVDLLCWARLNRRKLI